MPRSLLWATDIDVLPLDRVVQPRDGYLVVRSPSHPGHYWGNLLLFDQPPEAGDGQRWEERFDAEFAAEPRVRHRTLAWDRIDGALGSARQEFAARGYDLEQIVGLIATADGVRPHPRENRHVVVRALDPAAYRRRGICSRLVVEAAQRSTELHGARQFVIGADLGYHALGLYESLGFETAERVCGVCRWPRS